MFDTYDDMDTQKHVIIKNTLNGSILGVERTIYKDIHHLTVDKIMKYFQNNGKTEIYEQLVDNGFIIEDTFDEQENFLKLLHEQWNNDDTMHVHFLPTTSCNFNCPYCYQDGVDRSFMMTKQNVVIILARMEEYLNSNKQLRKLMLTLHGGEPTCNWSVVPYFLENVEELLKRHNIKMYTSIVTNTYLLNEEKAALLNKYNWVRLQATLDGVGEINNKRRRLKSGGQTFETIVHNLKYILEKDLIKSIDLRINYDNENVEEIPDLLIFLADNFSKDRLNLSFGNIAQTVEGNDAYNYISKTIVNNNSFIEKYLELYKAALKLGFQIDDSFLFSSMCIGKLKHSFVVSPDGNIYKCLSSVGRINESSGQWEGKDAFFQIPSLMNFELYEQCFRKKCPFIPICHCDCRFDAMIARGDMDYILCRKDLLLNLNRKITMEYYKDIIS